jgi:DNA-binding LacI/PurR family transcriptional regulator
MTSGNPKKYEDIMARLKADISAGRYDAGRPLPSENALMRRFGVSRHTVLRAVRELQAEGLLVRRQGAGTFLTRKATETRRIALVIHGSEYCEIFSPIARQVSHLCQKLGYTLLLGDISYPEPRRRAARMIELVREYVKQGIDGVILQPVELLKDSARINSRICSIFDAAQVPVVLLDSDITPPPERSGYDIIGINHFDAGRRMARHLREVGAKRIAYLMQADRAPCVQERWKGVKFGCEGLALAGEPLVAEPDDVPAVRGFLRRYRPDAIACYNDRQAVLAIQTLASIGKRTPDDIIVAGFDDVNYAKLSVPKLTTIRQPCGEIAQAAVKMLMDRIESPHLLPREMFLPAPLVVRESTARKEKAR